MIVSDYIYDMPMYMAAADAVVCRAGAMTLSEVAMLGKPAVLIPSPHVTDDHQYKNAKVLSDKGGAILVREEKEVDENSMSCKLASEAVESLYYDKKQREEMSAAVTSFARPDAGKLIFDEIIKLTEKK
jgi:UDP-N-acetylglucosamine--N-acetylmuramyl-(pentapeptide) pyrophosphoryl-undecaprenol N-acetylglucosamine transferase